MIVRLVCIVLMLMLPAVSAAEGLQWISPQRVSNLVREGSGLWLLDLRGEPAFSAGHIEGAMNLPVGVIANKRLPKGKIIVLVDDSLGLRKGREAVDFLEKNGHDKVYLLEGGMPAWLNQGYPVAGEGKRTFVRRVMPEDIRWAQENRIPVLLFDVREKEEQSLEAVPQAVSLEGKTLAERLEKAKEIISVGAKKGFVAPLDKPVAVVLVFPSGTDPQETLDKFFKGVPTDVRFLDGAYARSVRQDKNSGMVGACPTCSGGAP